MAEFMKKPGDFSLPLQKSYSQPELIPPSKFEGKSSEDPWRSLVKASNEILQLKLENQSLKESKPAVIPTSQPIRAQVDIHHTKNYHLDEVITRQASEIIELRKQLDNNTFKCEQQRLQQVGQLKQQLLATETQLKSAGDLYRSQVVQLQRDQEESIFKEKSSYEQIQKELLVVNNTNQKLQDEIDSLKIDFDDTVSQLQNRVKLKECKLDEQKRELNQMKVYLTQTQDYAQSKEAWKTEREDWNSNIQELQAENNSLQSTIDLVTVRFSAINEILTIQENELRQCKLGMNQKKADNLLNRWREKVFSLLVQLKSVDIANHKVEFDWKNKVKILQDELSSVHNQNKVLSHSLQDKNAELQLAMNNIKTLENNITKTQQMALTVDSQLKVSQQAVVQLAESVQRTHAIIEEKEAQFLDGSNNLQKFEHRLSFASGRVQMLQGLLLRHQTVSKMKEQETKNEQQTQTEVGPKTMMLEEDYLVSELERVTKERDCLVAQIKNDSQLMEQKISHVKQQVENEMISLRDALSHLEKQTQEKTQQCYHLSEELEHAHNDIDELQDIVKTLKTDLAKQQLDAEKAMKERLVASESSYVEQLAEMEKKINDARREHTKAVISLRQMERQAVRDKERASEHAQSVDKYYKDIITKQEHQMKALESERNLMMATLRQEGLLCQLRSQRPPPVLLDRGDNPDISKQKVYAENLKAQSQATEPLCDVLDDIHQLSAQVLEDSD